MADAAFEPDKFVQAGVGRVGIEIEVLPAPFGVITEFDGNGLQQGRFAGAVFADEKGDRGVEFQPLQVPDRRNAKRVFLKTRHPIALEPHRVDEPTFDHGPFRFLPKAKQTVVITVFSASFFHR